MINTFTEVGEQAAIGEELCDYINGPLFGADTIQLDQVLVSELPDLTQEEGRNIFSVCEWNNVDMIKR